MNSAAAPGMIERLRRSPGKAAVLGICFVLASWTWVGILFGGDRAKGRNGTPSGATPVSPNAGTTPAVPRTGTSTGGKKAPIADFQTAMNRIATWRGPLGLYLERSEEFSIAVPEIVDSESIAESGPARPPLPELTGTVLLGPRSFAFLDGERVQVGDVVGRYEVRTIRPREVVLGLGKETFVVTITPRLAL